MFYKSGIAEGHLNRNTMIPNTTIEPTFEYDVDMSYMLDPEADEEVILIALKSNLKLKYLYYTI